MIVINLQRRADRKSHMEELVRRLLWEDITFFLDALDGMSLGEHGLRTYAIQMLGVRPELAVAWKVGKLGVAALALSVAAALTDFLDSSRSTLLLLEDDVDLVDIKENGALENELGRFLCGEDFDFVWLEHNLALQSIALSGT